MVLAISQIPQNPYPVHDGACLHAAKWDQTVYDRTGGRQRGRGMWGRMGANMRSGQMHCRICEQVEY